MKDLTTWVARMGDGDDYDRDYGCDRGYDGDADYDGDDHLRLLTERQRIALAAAEAEDAAAWEASREERAVENLLDRLYAQGFDRSTPTPPDPDCDRAASVAVRCSQCAAAVINGVACHETGCPRTTKKGRKP